MGIAETWENERWKTYNFNVVCKSDCFDVSRVHPLKQKDAIAISESLKGDSRLSGVVLFGSSTNMRCTSQSDLDVLVKLKPEYCNRSVKNDVSEVIQQACDWNADVLWFDSIDEGSQLYKHAELGVQIA